MNYICIMKNTAFTFDDVRIPPDRQIGLHSHSCWELSYVVWGGGFRTIGDMTESFRQGEVVLIPPAIPHEWRFDPAITDSDGNIANISVFFENHIMESMGDLFPEIAAPLTKIRSLGHAVFYTGETLREISCMMLSMREMPPEKRLPRMIDLLLSISDISGSRFAGKGIPLSRTEQRLEKIRVYCACNYDRQITLDEVSRYVGMNKSSLCTFLRRHTGTTLSEYVNHMRLDRAKEKLMHTDRNIAEIALACGFQNVTYFNRLFRARFGCTPRESRSCK